MFDVVVVSILKMAEDGFHKLSEGYGIYVVRCKDIGLTVNIGKLSRVSSRHDGK